MCACACTRCVSLYRQAHFPLLLSSVHMPCGWYANSPSKHWHTHMHIHVLVQLPSPALVSCATALDDNAGSQSKHSCHVPAGFSAAAAAAVVPAAAPVAVYLAAPVVCVCVCARARLCMQAAAVAAAAPVAVYLTAPVVCMCVWMCLYKKHMAISCINYIPQTNCEAHVSAPF